jgi:hypothetical protein
MGAVFLAEQIAVGNRPVALKVLSRKLLDDPNFLLRFQNEAVSTGRIHHVNVVTIYESGQADDGTPYIAMEFLEGESLRQALSRRDAPVNRRIKSNEQTGSVGSAADPLPIVARVVIAIRALYTREPSTRREPSFFKGPLYACSSATPAAKGQSRFVATKAAWHAFENPSRG